MGPLAQARAAERLLLKNELTYDQFLAELNAVDVIITDDGEFRVELGGWEGRTCTKCHEVKGPEGFRSVRRSRLKGHRQRPHRWKKGRYALNSWCRACETAERKRQRTNNLPREEVYHRQYQLARYHRQSRDENQELDAAILELLQTGGQFGPMVVEAMGFHRQKVTGRLVALEFRGLLVRDSWGRWWLPLPKMRPVTEIVTS